MKLSKLEKKLLKSVSDYYPPVWSEVESKKIKTIDERPLASEPHLSKAFSKYSKEELEAAMKHLEGIQCIKKVYLYSPEDFEELTLSPGNSMRVPFSKGGSGTFGYQATQDGREMLENLPSTKFFVFIGNSFKKLFEDNLPKVLLLILGVLGVIRFQWILSKLQNLFR